MATFKQLNKANGMTRRKLLTLAVSIFIFCNTNLARSFFSFCAATFAEETKISKYPNILHLTPEMERDLERADSGDYESTLNLRHKYGNKILEGEDSIFKFYIFMIEMQAAAEAQGSHEATKMLNSELHKSEFKIILITKARAIANSAERKSQTKPISKILERYSKIDKNTFYHLSEIDKMYKELGKQTEK